MRVLGNLEIQPLKSRDPGATARAIEATQAALQRAGVEYATRATVTELEGELRDVLRAVERIPEAVHDLGEERVQLTMRLESERGATPRLARGDR